MKTYPRVPLMWSVVASCALAALLTTIPASTATSSTEYVPDIHGSYLSPPTRSQDQVLAWTESVLRKIEEISGTKRNDLTLEAVKEVLSNRAREIAGEQASYQLRVGLPCLTTPKTVLVFGSSDARMPPSFYQDGVLIDAQGVNAWVRAWAFSVDPGDVAARKTLLFRLNKCASYVPMQVFEHVMNQAYQAHAMPRAPPAAAPRQDPTAALVQHDQSTVINIDLSGFTRLSEELKKHYGEESKEQILRLTNLLLSDLSNLILKYNGSIVKFGGDARTVLMTGEDHAARGIELAGRIQALMYFYRDLVKKEYGWENPIKVSIGIASGPSYLFIAKDYEGFRDIIPLGHVWFEAATAEDLVQGENAVGHSTIAALPRREDQNVEFKQEAELGDVYTPQLRQDLKRENVHVIKRIQFLNYMIQDKVSFYREYIRLLQQAYPPAHEATKRKFQAMNASLTKMTWAIAAGLHSVKELQNIDQRAARIKTFLDAYADSTVPLGSAELQEQRKRELWEKARLAMYVPYYQKRRAALVQRFLENVRQANLPERPFLEAALADVRSFIRPGLQDYILSDETTHRVQSVSFQNLTILFVGVQDMPDWFDAAQTPQDRAKALSRIEEFVAKMNAYAREQEDITPLKWDIGPHALKWLLVSGMRTGVDPEFRAVVAARNFMRMAKEEFGIDLKIGIHNGPVFFGLTGNPRTQEELGEDSYEFGDLEFTTISPDVNLAARLCRTPGHILVSPNTISRTHDRVRYASHGTIPAKGIGDVQVFEPQEILAPVPMKYFPLAKELEQLREWVRRPVQEGTSGPMLITQSHPGMGTEELVLRVTQLAKDNGMQVYQNSGTLEKNEFDLFHSLLSSVFDLRPTDTPAERVNKITFKMGQYLPDAQATIPLFKLVFPYLTFPGEDMLSKMEMEYQYSMFADILRRLLLAESQNQPLFLCIKAMDRIKGSTAQLLAPLVSGLSNARVCLLVTHEGPVEAGQWFAGTQNQIAVQPLTQEEVIKVFDEQMSDLLGPEGLADRIGSLQSDDLRRLVRRRFTHEEIVRRLALPLRTDFTSVPDEPLRRLLYDEVIKKLYTLSADGNLMFLGNQTKRLAAKLQEARTSDRAHDLPVLLIQDILSQQVSVGDVDVLIVRQYERDFFAHPQFSGILKAAMSFGETFDVKLLAMFLSMDEAALQQRLFTLRKMGILVPTENPDRVSFAPYIHAVFSRRYETGAMRQGNVEVARFLKATWQAKPQEEQRRFSPIIAARYLSALDLNRKWVEFAKEVRVLQKQDLIDTLATLQMAAEYYQEIYRYSESIAHYQRLLELLKYLADNAKDIGLDGEEKIRLEAQLLDCHEHLGELSRNLGLFDQATDHFRHVIDHTSDTVRKIRLLGIGLALIYRRVGNLVKAQEAVEEQARCIQSLGDGVEPAPFYKKRVTMVNHLRMGDVLLDKGEWEEAKKQYEIALGIADELKTLPDLPVLISVQIGHAHMEMGAFYKEVEDWDQALSHLTRALEYSSRSTFQTNVASCQVEIAEALIASNRGQEALQHAQEAVLICRQKWLIAVLRNALNAQGAAFRLLGDRVNAERTLEEVYEISQKIAPLSHVQVVTLREYGRVLESKDVPRAIALLKQSLDVANSIEDKRLSDREYLNGALALIELYVDHDKLEEAEQFLPECRQRFQRIDPRYRKMKEYMRKVIALDRLEAQVLLKIAQSRGVLNEEAMGKIIMNLHAAKGFGEPLIVSRAFLVLVEALADEQLQAENSPFWSEALANVGHNAGPVIEWLNGQNMPGDQRRLGQIYQALGSICHKRQDVNKALDYYRRSLQVFAAYAQAYPSQDIQSQIATAQRYIARLSGKPSLDAAQAAAAQLLQAA